MRTPFVQAISRHGIALVLTLSFFGSIALSGLGFQTTRLGLQRAEDSYAARRSTLLLQTDLVKLGTDLHSYKYSERPVSYDSFSLDRAAFSADLRAALYESRTLGENGAERPLVDIEHTFDDWSDVLAGSLLLKSTPKIVRLRQRGDLLLRRMQVDDSQALHVLDGEANAYMALTRERLSIGTVLSVIIGFALYFVILTLLRTQLRIAHEHTRFVTTAQDIVAVARFDGYFISFNPAANRILGYKRDELLSQPFMSFVHPDDVESTTEVMKGLVDGQTVDSFHNRYRGADGNYRWLVWNAVPDLARKVIYCTGRDETERVLSEREHERMAYTDTLTDLPNRAMFMACASRAVAIARRGRSEVAFVLFDLNGFKAVNDSLGHSVGDDVLVAIAQRVKSVLRVSDFVARLGGDEFTVLLEAQSGMLNVDVVVRKIHETIREPLNLMGQEIRLGASIGVAIYPGDGDNAASLLAHADAAMYREKRLSQRPVHGRQGSPT